MIFDPAGRVYQYPTMIQLPDVFYGLNMGQLEAARAEHRMVFGYIGRLIERAWTNERDER